MENLAEGLQRQISRNQELLEIYKTIPTGAFGAAMIKRDLDAAIKAMAEGDTVAMISAYKALEGNK